MNAEGLLAHFERIADAPDAIVRLRRFILDLAVRGKLVRQDPNDEPASELLKRIQKARARLGVNHVISPLGTDETPFELPKGWSWNRVGEICSKTGSGSTPRGGKGVYKESGVPFLRSQNIYDDGLRLDGVAYIDLDTHSRMGGTRVLPGDLLLNITGGSIGRCCRVPDNFGEANVSQHVAIIRTAFKGIETFLHRLVLSPYFQAFVFDEQTGAGRGGLPKNRMDRIAVALPPLAEQHRIVTKVDELMALCDRLGATRGRREATRDKLTAASHARLNAPDPETFQDDARFALDALPALTARPDQIKQLRQTILNFAVRGKLVQQDANDEPASELLKLIAKKKELLSANGRGRRKAVIIEALAGDSVPFESPSGWVWAAFGDIVVSRDGERVPVSREERNSRAKLFDYYGASGVIDKIDNFLFDKPLLLIGEDGANLINRSTPIAFIARGKYWVNNHAHVLDGPSEEFLRYVALFINAIDLKPYVTGTAQPKMNQAKMNSIPVALPPLAEQRRIVAKVDELMTLCDRLEASLATGEDIRRRLLDALLAEAVEPVDRDLEQAA
jgi:type I restriction enzyme S subunit